MRFYISESTVESIGFTAIASGNFSYESNSLMTFDQVQTNIGGFYNNVTSWFICPFDAMYIFHLSIVGLYDEIQADIMLENEPLATVRTHGGHESQGSNIAVIKCLATKRVWVEIKTNGLVGGEEGYTSFSGLLSERRV